MIVLSLFDGISCGQLALERSGIHVDNYYASEIKKFATKLVAKHFPKTIHLGDVTNIITPPKADLLIGGSPCQDLSPCMKNRTGLNGSKSILFWEYIRILNIVNPKYFLLENVARMPQKDRDIITKEVGVQPIQINSSLVSAQLRSRYYWTNIPNITQPEDKNIKLQSILEYGYTDREKARCLTARNGYEKSTNWEKVYDRYHRVGFNTIVFNDPSFDWTKGIRHFTTLERERLQTLPEGYTIGLTYNQAADVIGDGWTVDVISHIFNFMDK